MPFKEIGPDQYRGPSGKVFNRKQVALYYANNGAFPANPKSKKERLREKVRRRNHKQA
jgi:hypothetical protein